MDQHEPKSNLRRLPPPVAKAEPGQESKKEVATRSDEVKRSSQTAKVLRFPERGLKDESTSAEIYERRLPELMALSAKAVLRVNLPVQRVVVTVLGVLPRLRALREQFEATFRVFDFEQFDSLEDYAFTLYYAQTLVLGAERPASCSPELKQEIVTLQRALLADCRALEERGLLDRSKRRHVKAGSGFQIWANNLAILGQVLRDSWPAIAGRCATTAANLQRADELAHQLLSLRSERVGRPANVARAKDLRARAFTLLMRAYQRARLAALYVLGNERDLNAVAPRLSRKSGRGRKTKTSKRRSKDQLTNDTDSEDSTKQ